jgi:hypothetical protein
MRPHGEQDAGAAEARPHCDWQVKGFLACRRIGERESVGARRVLPALEAAMCASGRFACLRAPGQSLRGATGVTTQVARCASARRCRLTLSPVGARENCAASGYGKLTASWSAGGRRVSLRRRGFVSACTVMAFEQMFSWRRFREKQSEPER